VLIHTEQRQGSPCVDSGEAMSDQMNFLLSVLLIEFLDFTRHAHSSLLDVQVHANSVGKHRLSRLASQIGLGLECFTDLVVEGCSHCVEVSQRDVGHKHDL